jgi:hypothetical protein
MLDYVEHRPPVPKGGPCEKGPDPGRSDSPPSSAPSRRPRRPQRPRLLSETITWEFFLLLAERPDSGERIGECSSGGNPVDLTLSRRSFASNGQLRWLEGFSSGSRGA